MLEVVFPLWILRRRLHLGGCLSLLLLRIHLQPLTLALSSSSSTPTPSSSTLDSATSNLTPSSTHYEPFHANPLLTHTRDVHTRATGDE